MFQLCQRDRRCDRATTSSGYCLCRIILVLCHLMPIRYPTPSMGIARPSPNTNLHLGLTRLNPTAGPVEGSRRSLPTRATGPSSPLTPSEPCGVWGPRRKAGPALSGSRGPSRCDGHYASWSVSQWLDSSLWINCENG